MPEAGLDHDHYPDRFLRTLLNSVKTIAMVGATANPSRPAYLVLRYLLQKGYRVIPVNPGHAGGEILGQKAYARLADIPFPVDMVDIFRKPELAAAVVDEALALDPKPQSDLDAARHSRRCRGGAGRGGRRHRRHESLPEDRVRSPLRRKQLGRNQFRHDLVAEADTGAGIPALEAQ